MINVIPKGIKPQPMPEGYRPTEARDRAKAERRHHKKIYKLNQAEMFNPRLSRIYYSSVDELPDRVHDYPGKCQRAFMVTFNNWLRKSGDVPKSMFAANKALNRVWERIKRERIDEWKTKPQTDYDAMLPRRPQIVVA